MNWCYEKKINCLYANGAGFCIRDCCDIMDDEIGIPCPNCGGKVVVSYPYCPWCGKNLSEKGKN